MLAILVHVIKGGVKRRITVEEKLRQNIMFNQKLFRISTLEPTDITTYDKYVYILLEILLLVLRSLNSTCDTLLRIF